MLFQKIVRMSWVGSFFAHGYCGLVVREMKLCTSSWKEGCYVIDFFWRRGRKSVHREHCDYGFLNGHCDPICISRAVFPIGDCSDYSILWITIRSELLITYL
jgi:hypothetical protein